MRGGKKERKRMKQTHKRLHTDREGCIKERENREADEVNEKSEMPIAQHAHHDDVSACLEVCHLASKHDVTL